MGSSTLLILGIYCFTSVMVIMVDSRADSMGDNPDFQAWEAMLRNLSRQGKNGADQLIGFNACIGYW